MKESNPVPERRQAGTARREAKPGFMGDAARPGELTAAVLLACFFRTYFVATAFNSRGLQTVGLLHALSPGLTAIHRDAKELKEARKRYLFHYNSHPFFTPLLTAIFLSMEVKIARGQLPPQILGNLRTTTAYTLSAVGDSFFGGSLSVFWSLTACLLAMQGHTGLALAWVLVSFALLQGFKAVTFVAGYREDLRFLQRLKQWDLVNWGQRLKLVNGLLLALLLLQLDTAWPGASGPFYWLLGVAALGVTAHFVNRHFVPREVVAIVVLSVYACLPWLTEAF